MSDERAKEASRKHYLAHKEEIKARRKVRRENDAEKERIRVYQRAYRKTRSAESKARVSETQRSYQLRTRYGLSLNELGLMHDVQDGKCALCGGTDALVVDHDHNTDKVRALLCNRCNLGVGWVECTNIDDVLTYIDKYKEECND